MLKFDEVQVREEKSVGSGSGSCGQGYQVLTRSYQVCQEVPGLSGPKLRLSLQLWHLACAERKKDTRVLTYLQAFGPVLGTYVGNIETLRLKLAAMLNVSFSLFSLFSRACLPLIAVFGLESSLTLLCTHHMHSTVIE